MPKAIKGTAGRKPPEPTNHADIDEWRRHLMPDLQPLIERLDQVIQATVPGLGFAVDRQRAYYGLLPELGWIIELAPYAVSANVLFLGGADFESPPLLGTTDRIRYAKVTNVAQAEGPELREWIEQAGRTPGWKG
jgi:hypothetical protein